MSEENKVQEESSDIGGDIQDIDEFGSPVVRVDHGTWEDFVDTLPLVMKTGREYSVRIEKGKAIIKRDAEAGLDQEEVSKRHLFIQEIVRSAYAKGFQV